MGTIFYYYYIISCDTYICVFITHNSCRPVIFPNSTICTLKVVIWDHDPLTSPIWITLDVAIVVHLSIFSLSALYINNTVLKGKIVLFQNAHLDVCIVTARLVFHEFVNKRKLKYHVAQTRVNHRLYVCTTTSKKVLL